MCASVRGSLVELVAGWVVGFDVSVWPAGFVGLFLDGSICAFVETVENVA